MWAIPTEHRNLMCKDVILEIEVQGALQVKEIFPEAILLFVTPPSIAELKKRLTGRGTEAEEVVNKRILRAAEEVVLMNRYDYILVNDDLDECMANAVKYIDAAKCAPVRNEHFIKGLKEELEGFSKGV